MSNLRRPFIMSLYQKRLIKIMKTHMIAHVTPVTLLNPDKMSQSSASINNSNQNKYGSKKILVKVNVIKNTT